MDEEPGVHVEVFQVLAPALRVRPEQLLQAGVLGLGDGAVAQGGEQPL